MGNFIRVKTAGDEMLVAPSRKNLFMVAGFILFCGVLMAGYGVRKLTGMEQDLAVLGAAVCLVFSVFSGLFYRTVVLDARKKFVSARWHLGGLSGSEQRDVGEGDFRVERSRTKSDSGTTYHFTAYFSDLRLFEISEYQGGQNEAERVANAMAQHVDRKFTGTRDSARLKQAVAREAKYALYPLFFVVLMLALGAVYAVFLT